MSAEITTFKLELRLDATVEINGKAWVKPGITTGITWNEIPEQWQVDRARQFLNTAIIDPTMAELTDTVIEQTKKAHGLE